MPYTIRSARFCNPFRTSMVIDTVENGPMVVSKPDSPALWHEVLAQTAVEAWVEPPVEQVTAAQARLALDDAGLLDQVEAVVTGHPVRAVKIWYGHALNWERDNPYVQALATEMGLTDAQVDALFLAASKKG